MNWEDIQSNWPEFKGSVKQHWNKISKEQLNFIAGRREYLVRKIQTAYDVSKDEAESQLSEWQALQINIDGHFYQSQPLHMQRSARV